MSTELLAEANEAGLPREVRWLRLPARWPLTASPCPPCHELTRLLSSIRVAWISSGWRDDGRPFGERTAPLDSRKV